MGKIGVPAEKSQWKKRAPCLCFGSGIVAGVIAMERPERAKLVVVASLM